MLVDELMPLDACAAELVGLEVCPAGLDLRGLVVECVQLVDHARSIDDLRSLAYLLAPSVVTTQTAVDVLKGTPEPELTRLQLEPLGISELADAVDLRVRVVYWTRAAGSREEVTRREVWTFRFPRSNPSRAARCPGCGAPVHGMVTSCRYCSYVLGAFGNCQVVRIVSS